MENVLRLDLFLKASRLCQRRAIAQQLCDAGLVLVNHKKAKPAHAVRPGDEVTINARNRVTRIRVLAEPTARQTSRKEAVALYEILSEDPKVPGSQ
ncbi:MAG: RNA-binding S4 domain-containing protein [Pyrinomonadaceae bacterium]